MFTAKIVTTGSKALGKKLQRFAATVEQQQRRAMYRALRAARTLAAKRLRRESGIPSRVLKRSLIAAKMVDMQITARRKPIPVEQIGARALKGKRSRKRVKIRKWYGDHGVAARTFHPAWQGNEGKFYSTHKSASGRPYRLVARSVARIWVGLIPDIEKRAAEVYRRSMDSYFKRT